MDILKVSNVTKNFGGIVAVDDVSFQVRSGEIVGLIGPNGAGKTTMFNLLSGVIRPSAGSIVFKDENIVGIKPNRIARKGLIRTYQATKLFMELSVLENIQIACNIFARANLIGDLIGLSSVKREKNEIKKRAIEICKLVGLEKMDNELAKNLPHGFQRILGVAIALATGPKILCLDEPLTGMNFEEVNFMVDLIKKINKNDTTILLVEHSMKVVMSICDKLIVLNFGGKIAEGRPKEIRNNQDVIEAYLGRSQENAA